MALHMLRRGCCGVWLVAALAWTAAAVEFAGGMGEPADPYQIATVEHLVSIGDDADLLDKYFVLVNDLDLDPQLPGGRIFNRAVIAHGEHPNAAPYPAFSGRFYGEGHTIRNLTIYTETLQYLGLFGAISSTGRVYDLGLEDVSIEGPGRIGALAGSSGGSVVSCHASGSICVADEGNWVGGLIGTNSGGISDCHTAVTVTAGNGGFQLGGLVGVHRGRIVNSSATGDVCAGRKSFDVGGLVGGCLGGSIEYSQASGRVVASEGSWSLGGVLGSADSNAWIVFCRAGGDVTGGRACRDLGGLVGHLRGEVSNCNATGDVDACDGSSSLGGLAGSLLGGTVSDSYAMGAVAGGSGSRSLGGMIGQARTSGYITNCYAAGRLMRAGAPYGRGGLIGHIENSRRIHVTRSFWDCQSSGAPESAAGVGLTTAEMRDVETFRTARWDLAGVRLDGTADVWRVPDGGGYPLLTAFDDPNALHTLEGAGTSYDPYRIATAADLGAVGRYSRHAWYKLVDDIDLADVTWTCAPVPVLRGYFNGNGRRITNLTVAGGPAGELGLFGRVESRAWVYDLGLENISIAADANVTNVGGLAGINAGTIVGCYVTGGLLAGANSLAVGGIVGSNRRGMVADSYATAGVSTGAGNTRAGGLAGFNYDGTISGCYAAGHVTHVGDSRYAGLLVGRDLQFSRVVGSYVLAPGTGGPDNGIGTALTDEQMKQKASFVDWNFTRTWTICEGQTYPRLQWEEISCHP